MLNRLLQEATLSDYEDNIIKEKLKRIELKDVEEYLSQGDVDVDAIFGKIKAPLLHLAVCAERMDIIKLLLDYGADPELKDGAGCVAWKYNPRWTQNESNRKEIDAALEKAKFIGHPIDIMSKLRYMDMRRRTRAGVCYGLAAVGMDYMMRGKEGIKELDDLLLALGSDDTDAAVEKINAMQKIRQKYVEDNKQKQIDNLLQQVSDEKKEEEIPDQKIRMLYKIMINEKENSDETIILFLDKSIQSKKPDMNEEARNLIIQKIIQHLHNDNYLLDEVDNPIWINIQDEIFEKIKNIIVSKRLDNGVRNKLKAEYNQRDVALLDAPNYLQGIAISQDPDIYKHYFAKNISWLLDQIQQNVVITFPLISSSITEKQGFATPPQGGFSVNSNKAELEILFKTWKEYLNEGSGIEKPISFMLGDKRHAISITYLPQEDAWAFNEYSGKKTVLIKDEKSLVDNIFEAFSSPSIFSFSNESVHPKRLNLKCCVYSSKKDEKTVNSSLEKMLVLRDHNARKKREKMEGGLLFVGGLVGLIIGISIVVTSLGLAVAGGTGAAIATAIIGVGASLVSTWLLKKGYDTFLDAKDHQNEIVRTNAERDAVVVLNASKKSSHSNDPQAEIEPRITESPASSASASVGSLRIAGIYGSTSRQPSSTAAQDTKNDDNFGQTPKQKKFLNQ